MQFIPDETYIETSLQEGLNALETGKAERLQRTETASKK